MQLASPAFDRGDPLPEESGYEHGNTTPPLTIGDVPGATVSLALIVDDPDAREPAGKVWDHWVVWNIDPGRSQVREGESLDASEGKNDFGESGYGGPKPPDGEHTYRFRLYALDAELDLDADTTAEDLRTAMEGHVLDDADLAGTYAPK